MTLKYDKWPADHSAEMLRLRASGLEYAAIAVALNAQFGSNRTRKTCSSHAWDLTRRSSVRKRWCKWPVEHDDFLKHLLPTLSLGEIAEALNREFGTNYTRNSCIGRANRLSSAPKKPRPKGVGKVALNKRKSHLQREKRWAADPTLEELYKRRQEMAANRAKMLTSGRPKTSREYRVHMPKVGNMTKGELRAMLSQAVQNTAAMDIAA